MIRVRYESDNLEALLRAIFHMQYNCMKKEFERRGILKASHPPILFMLRHGTDGMAASQKEIADRLGISTPTVAISVKRMEKAGLLHKVSDESDLRRNLITLTEDGKRQVDEAQNVFEGVYTKMFEGFSPEDCERLKAYFLRIISNLETMGAQPPERLRNNICEKKIK